MPTRNVTEPGTLLGTIGYMAPEQARDPHAVDNRADLFSLGASMYWALTGREPYPETGNTIQDLHRRMTTSAPPVRQIRPEVPAEVSDLIGRLMEMDPDRATSARTVAATLTGFALWLPTAFATQTANPTPSSEKNRRQRVLLVEDEDTVRLLMMQLLKDRYDVHEARDGEDALAEISRNPPDLVVVDVNLPGFNGSELITRMRAQGLDPDRVKVLLMSGSMPDEALGGLSTSGADDFLMKPFKTAEFISGVRTHAPAGTAPGRTLCGNATLRIAAHATVRAAAPSPPPLRGSAPGEALSLMVSRLLVETNLAAEGTGGESFATSRTGGGGHRSGRVFAAEGRRVPRFAGRDRANLRCRLTRRAAQYPHEAGQT